MKKIGQWPRIPGSGPGDVGSNPTGAIMKLLAQIRDEDLGLVPKCCSYKKRLAARAVLLNKKKIALLYVSSQEYYKLPGGGVEEKETIEEALGREMLEETGCTIKIISDIGAVVEYRTHIGILQTSNCFIAEAKTEGTPEFDEGEKTAGYKLEWKSIDNAIKAVHESNPADYEGKFIVKRDLIFLKAAKRLLD